MKYLIWEHRTVDTKTVSQTELSFNSPRHGVSSLAGEDGALERF